MHNFLALAMRQQFIARWSLMRCSTPESVLEHTASVSLIAMMLGLLANQRCDGIEPAVSIERLMAHALLHDMSEVYVSDVVTPVKKANPAIAAEFRKLELEAEQLLIAALPESLRSEVGAFFALDGYEQQLFKCADVYSAWVKSRLEIAAGNEGEFRGAHDTLRASVETLILECPELAELDASFGGSIGSSIDELMNH